MAAVCAWIRGVLTRLSGTAEKLSGSERIVRSPVAGGEAEQTPRTGGAATAVVLMVFHRLLTKKFH
jgi:hypothetical protein